MSDMHDNDTVDMARRHPPVTCYAANAKTRGFPWKRSPHP